MNAHDIRFLPRLVTGSTYTESLHAPHAPHLIVCFWHTVCLLLMHILPMTTPDQHRISDETFTVHRVGVRLW